MANDTIEVSIFGHEYSIKGSAPTEYINELASYVDGKMQEISEKTSIVSSSKVAILAALNIADEVYQYRSSVDESKAELNQRIDKLVAALDKLLQ